jgi:hypothetical protein
VASESAAPNQLIPGEKYTWEELGAYFDFAPAYLSVAGGMLSRPAMDALLIITWPGGARSFNYEDYWDGEDLIYTGRGKSGDQRLEGPNRDLAYNVRTNYVFEGGTDARALHFLGTAGAEQYWRARGIGDNQKEREILRYRLRFNTEGPSASGPRRSSRRAGRRDSTPTRSSVRGEQHRQRRRFDPTRAPTQYTTPVQNATPEETAARQEKANQAHHDLLVHLESDLSGDGWTNLDEIPSAIDLEGTKDNRRVLFEAKTVNPRSELTQTRSALSQLLEYRFFYGEPSDRLCLVTDGPISDRRIRFLEHHEVAVAYEAGEGLVPCGTLALNILG